MSNDWFKNAAAISFSPVSSQNEESETEDGTAGTNKMKKGSSCRDLNGKTSFRKSLNAGKNIEMIDLTMTDIGEAVKARSLSTEAVSDEKELIDLTLSDCEEAIETATTASLSTEVVSEEEELLDIDEIHTQPSKSSAKTGKPIDLYGLGLSDCVVGVLESQYLNEMTIEGSSMQGINRDPRSLDPYQNVPNLSSERKGVVQERTSENKPHKKGRFAPVYHHSKNTKKYYSWQRHFNIMEDSSIVKAVLSLAKDVGFESNSTPLSLASKQLLPFLRSSWWNYKTKDLQSLSERYSKFARHLQYRTGEVLKGRWRKLAKLACQGAAMPIFITNEDNIKFRSIACVFFSLTKKRRARSRNAVKGKKPA